MWARYALCLTYTFLGGLMEKLDLRKTEWREAIVEIASAVKESPLTIRALSILIAGCSNVTMTQAREVLEALPRLKKYYLRDIK